jgi:hypothetical protein
MGEAKVDTGVRAAIQNLPFVLPNVYTKESVCPLKQP